MLPSSDRHIRCEGMRRGNPYYLYFARTRARSAYTDRAFASLRKPSAPTFDGEPMPHNAIGNGKARFLLAGLVCGGRRRKGSPFCEAANG